MKRKFNKRWSTIPPISTKRTITSSSSRLTEHKKHPGILTLEIKMLTWNRHINVAGINRLMWSLDIDFNSGN